MVCAALLECLQSADESKQALRPSSAAHARAAAHAHAPRSVMVEPIFDYQFRLILIGDSTVGKSSLLKYFTDGKFFEVSSRRPFLPSFLPPSLLPCLHVACWRGPGRLCWPGPALVFTSVECRECPSMALKVAFPRAVLLFT